MDLYKSTGSGGGGVGGGGGGGGEQSFYVPGEIKRREVELDPQVKPEKIMSREVKIVQELCESRGGRPGLSVLTSLLVSVDVKKLLNRASALVTTCP